MKTILVVLLNLILIANSYAQGKISRFQYELSDGYPFATLNISSKGFLLESITSMIKPEGSDKIYNFASNGTKSAARLSSIENYLGSVLLHVDTANFGGNCIIDTIYFQGDTLINDFHCRKVNIDYIFHSKVDSPAAKQIINTQLWVCGAFALNNPLSFRSTNLNGLILRFERRYPSRSDYYYVTTSALPGVEDHALLQLPANCKICTTEAEFDEISRPILMQKISELKP